MLQRNRIFKEQFFPSPAVSRYQFARLFFWMFRFKSVPLATRLFASISTPCILKRSLFGHDFMIDVSRSMTHQLLFLEGERFVEERHLLTGFLRPGMHAVDIGANIGYYVLMFERSVGPTGQITMFEPSQENLPELKANIALNGFTNTILHECAIGAEDGLIGLKTGINSGVVGLDEGAYEVPIRTQNAMLKAPADFIKIDVEGYEGQVLAGAAEVIERDRPVLFVEMHPQMIGKFGFSCAQVVEGLRDHYPRVVFYRVRSAAEMGVADKIFRYYGNRSIVVLVESQNSFLAACDAGTINDTFWVVCHPD